VYVNGISSVWYIMFQCCDMFVCVVHMTVPALLSVASAAHLSVNLQRSLSSNFCDYYSVEAISV